MIPLKLTLENFKCYRTGVPALQLEGVHIACLCGANGHGKSTLLDAMTWALWGQVGSLRQDELVHLGQSDMRVELEFLVGSRTSGNGPGQRYRVIRRYARGRSGRAGASSLELHLAQDSSGEALRSISGSTIRETQAFITRLVGMEYDTFVNSAFLLQGRADAFTVRTPAERQRVLSKVLDLERYDRLVELAKDKVRQQSLLIQSIQGQLQAWEQQLSQRSEHQVELPRVEAALAQAGERLAHAEGQLRVLREQVTALQERQREFQELERGLQSAQGELRELQGQEMQQARRIKAWENLVARGEAITIAYVHLQELRRQEEDTGKQVGPYERLQERRRTVQQRALALPRLELEQVEVQQLLRGLGERENTLETRRKELQEMEVERQSKQSDNERLMREMQKLRRKVDMLSQGDARCPLCGAELEKDGREHIAGEYEAQGKAMALEHRQNQTRLRGMEPRWQELEGSLRREEREVVEQRRSLLARLGSLEQQLKEARKAPAEMAALDDELARLGYDPSVHQRLREAIQSRAKAEEEHRQLQEAQGRLPEERESLARVQGMMTRRQETIALGNARMQALRGALSALPEVEAGLAQAEARVREAQARYGQLMGRKGFLEERLKEYAALERQKIEAETQLAALAQQRAVYEELAAAFGRTGVQALLIEAAIPQLEGFANDYLGRMTDNTMHLRLETQRETQRGVAVETLEIKVADPLGTRSYDTFSGGEAFRINLALRIGLSRLLAYRAGAPLPTLFIDEGFGTQDAAGRERILEVLNTIADDFECILVISHMEEVKDAFPVRIEVQKTEEGSTFVMV